MDQRFTKDDIRAVDAKFEAQKIAFAPYAFQAARAMRELGILAALDRAGDEGASASSIAKETGLSGYGVGVLVEFALSMGIAKVAAESPEPRYRLGKVGFFLLHDEMTKVNMDFVHDVCYQGAFTLEESVRTGKPSGLRTFGDWQTVYQALASLPPKVRESWFSFDHFYSDAAFPEALPVVFARKPKRLLDIGGNTAKWALSCFRFDPEVRVTIVDLPGQAADARRNIEAAGAAARVDTCEANMLDPESRLPKGYDAVWMSQFLDCFSLEEVKAILRKVGEAVGPECDVWVLEPFWDKQRYPAASYSLHATSLYFTNIANGNSKMYRSDELAAAIAEAGFTLEESTHDLGANDYSLLRFRKARP